MPDQVKSFPIDEKLWMIKNLPPICSKWSPFLSHLFFHIGVLSYENGYRDKLRDDIENYDHILLNGALGKTFPIWRRPKEVS